MMIPICYRCSTNYRTLEKELLAVVMGRAIFPEQQTAAVRLLGPSTKIPAGLEK